ncbi:hypothetical protein H0H93_009176 [Arthromyces matolae]|nr:hypothetical protein H0H93_009176 [Arthromyces matolae]
MYSITTVEDEKGEKYRWKPIGNGSGSQLQLFAEYDEINPIASFQKSRTIGNRPGPVTPPASAVQPARLVLSQRGVDIQDIAVISFLVIEKNRRVKQARATADKEDIRMRYRTPWDSPNTATTGDLVNIAGPAF